MERIVVGQWLKGEKKISCSDSSYRIVTHILFHPLVAPPFILASFSLSEWNAKVHKSGYNLERASIEQCQESNSLCALFSSRPLLKQIEQRAQQIYHSKYKTFLVFLGGKRKGRVESIICFWGHGLIWLCGYGWEWTESGSVTAF